VHRIERPVLVYGILECTIGVSALCVPLGLWAARALQVAVIGGQPELPDSGGMAQSLFCLTCAFVVLLVPTTCMGATLPLLARHAVRSEDEVSRRIGWLYSINTAGAVLGTLVAGFVLLPNIGLRATVWCGVAVNLLVFVIAIQLQAPASRPSAKQTQPTHEPQTGPQSGPRPWPSAVLAVMLVSGAASFGYEILWTRMLSHLLGGSIYAFATMLASFLAGLALGSAAAARFAPDRARALQLFVAAQLGTALVSIGIFHLLDALPALLASAGLARWSEQAIQAVLAGGVLLPASLCIGATYPLAVRMLVDDPRSAGAGSGRVYAWNTAGAIAGSIFTGFYLLPAAGFSGAARALILTNTLLAAVICPWIAPRPWLARGAVAVVVSLAAVIPLGFPENLLRTATLSREDVGGELLLATVGESSTVTLYDQGGSYWLMTNGMPEAIVNSAGAPPTTVSADRWLSLLPVLARPSARSLLVIGFGGGVVVEDLPHQYTDVDVVELEPEVITANRLIADRRARDPLRDERVRVVINDARGALALTTKRWDIIVSQPSHPWTAGASHLFTREFAGLVAEHLTDDGVFVQWMNSKFVDVELLQSMTATLFDVYPQVRMYQLHGDMFIFLASAQPIEIEQLLATNSEDEREAWALLQRLGANSVEDVAACLMLDEARARTFAAGAPLVTDDRNRIAALSHMFSGPKHIAQTNARLAEFSPLATAGDAFVVGEVRLAPVPVVEAQARNLLQSITDSTARKIADPVQQQLATGVAYRALDAADNAINHFLSVLEHDPESQPALFLLIEPWLYHPNQREVPSAIRDLERRLTGTPQTLVELWHSHLRGDPQQIAKQQDMLAQVAPTAPWFNLSLKLRALAQLAGDPTVGEQRLHEALQIVDRHVARWSDRTILEIRIRVGAELHDGPVVFESARRLATQLERTPGQPWVRQVAARVLDDLQRTELGNQHPADVAHSIKQRFVELAATTARR
jgi:spermidine synthase